MVLAFGAARPYAVLRLSLDCKPTGTLMLELRPSCEHCQAALPADSAQAMICSFECTFCRACVETVLGNVCPNCGGGFCPRPVRPARNWKGDNCLDKYPAATTPKHRRVDVEMHRQWAQPIAALAPERR
jgi:hypothetical protein